jgi:hypothetical protein
VCCSIERVLREIEEGGRRRVRRSEEREAEKTSRER